MAHGPLAQPSDGLTIVSPVCKLGTNVLATVARVEKGVIIVITTSCGCCGEYVTVTHDQYHAGGTVPCEACDGSADLTHAMRHVGCYCEED